MKIGIITYFDIANYGSVLQAYAMQETLKQQGYNVVFLKIKEKKVIPKYVHKMYVFIDILIKIIRYRGALKTLIEIIGLNKESKNKMPIKTQKVIKVFIDKNLNFQVVSRLELKRRAYSNEFGVFICGSDQIWSPLSLHSSSFKYLTFAPREKRIAYAPSFGVEKIPSYNIKRLKKFLSGVVYLSIREITGQQIIKELTGKDSIVVLDPTLMVKDDFWIRISKVINEKYILCYFLSEPTHNEKKYIEIISKKLNLKIKVLPYKNSLLDIQGAEFLKADPLEFVSFFRNASFVFTNSFHGCAFSIIFNRPFIAYGRKHSDAVKQTSRITSLLSIIDLKDRYHDTLFNFVDKTLQCDYSRANVLLDKQRTKSLEYLLSSIRKVKLHERILENKN